MKNINGLIVVTAGALVGAAFAVLFTPVRGKVLRRWICYKSSTTKEMARMKIHNFLAEKGIHCSKCEVNNLLDDIYMHKEYEGSNVDID